MAQATPTTQTTQQAGPRGRLRPLLKLDVHHGLTYRYAPLGSKQMVTTVSRMLLEEREKEEAALEAIVDKQASAPSWWPASRGAMGGESHFQRIRRAEKILAREELQVVEGRGLPSSQEPRGTRSDLA